MLKRVFKLFQIARKLSTSGAIHTINQVHQIPISINLFFSLISIGSNSKPSDLIISPCLLILVITTTLKPSAKALRAIGNLCEQKYQSSDTK